MKTDFLIIGNGCSGVNSAKKIREKDSESTITIISSEKYIMYYRPKLVHYLNGEVSGDSMTMFNEEWYESKKIKNLCGVNVKKVDPQKKIVVTDNKEFEYKKLLFATGAQSFVPPIPGADSEKILTLRTRDDADCIIQACSNNNEPIVIGGGLLGLEIAASLAKIGKKVHVVEVCDRLLPRQIDGRGSKFLSRKLEQMNLNFFIGKNINNIDFNGDKASLQLTKGVVLTGGPVIVSAGVRPRIDLAKQAGIDTNRGIIVNSRLETNIKGIYAAGDCVEHQGQVYGIWPACMEQALIAGQTMTGSDVEYKGTVVSTSLKVAGIELVSLGNIDSENKLPSRIIEEENNYEKLVYQNEKLVGAILFGESAKKRGKILKELKD